jgi:hypothetical protein
LSHICRNPVAAAWTNRSLVTWLESSRASTAQAVEPFLKTKLLNDIERAMLMGNACAEAYGWSPSIN